MKQLNVVKENKPTIVEYELYDDYLEAHKRLANSNEFTFKYDPKESWRKITLNDVKYYQHYGRSYYGDKILLTEEAYTKLLEESKHVYTIHEYTLIRTQKNSNCRFTGDLESPEDVINYMRDENRSWLPKIYKECDEEIAQLQKKIDELNNIKTTLQNDDYLRGCIKTEIVVQSNKTKQF